MKTIFLLFLATAAAFIGIILGSILLTDLLSQGSYHLVEYGFKIFLMIGCGICGVFTLFLTGLAVKNFDEK